MRPSGWMGLALGLALCFPAVRAAEKPDYAGTYTIQGNQGPITLVLNPDAEGNWTGSLKGGTLSLQLKGFPKDDGGVLGTASDDQGQFMSFFQVAREGDKLFLELIEANAEGDPDYEKKTRIPFPAGPGNAASKPSSEPDGGGEKGEAPFAGVFKGEGMTLESKAAGGQYNGVIKIGDQSFPFTGKAAGGALTGTFKSPEGSFDFTGRLNGNRLAFETEGTAYTLTKQAPAKKPANPLAKGKPAPSKKPSNPLAAKKTPAGTGAAAKPEARQVKEPTGGPGQGAAWKTHQHATGLSMKYPPNWKLQPMDGGLQLIPPDVATSASGPMEAYFVLGQGTEGISSPEDPRVVAHLDQVVTQLAPFLRRTGGVEKIKAATAPGIRVTWEGANPMGVNLRAQANTTILKGIGITLFTMGDKSKIAARDRTMEAIFSSFAAGEGKRDPQIVGAWRFWSYKSSADGKFGSEQSRQMVLQPDGTALWSNKSESSGIFSGGVTGGYAGASASGDRGTWTAANGELYIQWEDGSFGSWDYKVSGTPGSRKLLLKGAAAQPDEWMEISG